MASEGKLLFPSLFRYYGPEFLSGEFVGEAAQGCFSENVLNTFLFEGICRRVITGAQIHIY